MAANMLAIYGGDVRTVVYDVGCVLTKSVLSSTRQPLLGFTDRFHGTGDQHQRCSPAQHVDSVSTLARCNSVAHEQNNALLQDFSASLQACAYENFSIFLAVVETKRNLRAKARRAGMNENEFYSTKIYQ